MQDITFFIRLNNKEGNTLELFIREHWLAKKLLSNFSLTFTLNNVPILMKQWRDAGNILLLRNEFKIDQ